MHQQTSATDVLETFACTESARRALVEWRESRPEVSEFVEGHVTRVPYLVDLQSLRKVMGETEHSLGNIKSRDVKEVHQIADWNPRFALTHVFHYALEVLGRPFTYQEFRKFCEENAVARAMLWTPAVDAIRRVAGAGDQKPVRDAMQWRVGNAYYSFVRELFVLLHFRAQGIDLQMHPLADALFRVDAWVGRVTLSLYIGNEAYRKGQAGRKFRAEHFLESGFDVLDVNLPAPNRFGQVHVPDSADLERAIEAVRAKVQGV